MLRLTLAATLVLVAAENPAQHAQHSPYADEARSQIAALTAADYAALRDGAGTGLAKAAELNGYPGPKHVLELAAELELSSQQRLQVQQAYERMHATAVDLGAQIIELEGELDRRFAHRHIDPETVRRLTADIGRRRGELRATHLLAHIDTTALLTAEQISNYGTLRGIKN